MPQNKSKLTEEFLLGYKDVVAEGGLGVNDMKKRMFAE